MRLSKIVIPMFITALAIIFNACTADNTVGDKITTSTNISIDVNCTATSSAVDITTYITTIAGDSIVQDETNTTISMFIDATDTKKVCLVSGKAHIVRQLSQ